MLRAKRHEQKWMERKTIRSPQTFSRWLERFSQSLPSWESYSFSISHHGSSDTGQSVVANFGKLNIKNQSIQNGVHFAEFPRGFQSYSPVCSGDVQRIFQENLDDEPVAIEKVEARTCHTPGCPALEAAFLKSLRNIVEPF